MYHPFSIAETLKIAWVILKKNFQTITVYSLLAIVIIFVLGFITYNVITDNILVSIGIVVLLVAISFIFLGFIKLVFRLIDKEFYDFEIGEIVPSIKMLFSYLILLIIVSALSVFMSHLIKSLDDELAQSLLGIFVGIFFQFFFLFYFPICTCFIVDDGSGPFESVVQSYELIKGNFIKYFVLFIFIETLLFIASITIIGMVIVMPFVDIILVVAYRKLIYSHLDVDDDIAETN
jgi:hypothetical protein